MKYVRLNDNFGLRGWDRLPFGILNFQTGATEFLNSEQWRMFAFCTGEIDVSNAVNIVPKEVLGNMQDGIARGFLEECKTPCSLKPYQKYKKADCRYINSVQWSITGKCNLKCRHCYVNAPDGLYGEPSFDECISAINQFDEANIAEVSITGGEPLVRKDFWDIVDALLDKRITVRNLYTNGLLVDDKFLRECDRRKLKLSFLLSFDGFGCHDWLRGTPGTEEKTIQAIRRIRGHGYPVEITTSLHRDNLFSLTETYELLKKLDVSMWKTSPLIDTGKWKNESDKKNIDITNLYNAYLKLIRTYRKDNMPMMLVLGGFYLNLQGDKNWYSPYEKFDGTERALNKPVCNLCRTHIYLAPNGKLLPCIQMSGASSVEEKAPNIFQTLLTEILSESSELFALINMRLRKIFESNATCGECEFRLKCGGGCRADALHATGDIFGMSKASCVFWKNDYQRLIRQTIADIENE